MDRKWANLFADKLRFFLRLGKIGCVSRSTVNEKLLFSLQRLCMILASSSRSNAPKNRVQVSTYIHIFTIFFVVFSSFFIVEIIKTFQFLFQRTYENAYICLVFCLRVQQHKQNETKLSTTQRSDSTDSSIGFHKYFQLTNIKVYCRINNDSFCPFLTLSFSLSTALDLHEDEERGRRRGRE